MTLNPYQLPDPQSWALDQERQRHTEALYRYGEYAAFVLLWRIEDLQAGYVGRCPQCYTAYGKIAEVYQQPSQNRCPTCYGTTFEGGVKARLVRPSLWEVTEPERAAQERGEVVTATASVQTTADFALRNGDYIFRADGTRWQMRTTGAQELRTGFEMTEHRTEVGWNYGTVAREDESSVAYSIPPTEADLKSRLDKTRMRWPLDFSDFEQVPAGVPLL